MKMLTKIIIVNVVLCFSSVATANHALSKIKGVSNVESCFSGEKQNYDPFIDHNITELKASSGNRGAHLKKAMVTERFTEAKFTSIKQHFDCQQIIYDVDGVKVEGFYLRKKGITTKQPLLLFNRGGNGNFGRIPMLSLIMNYTSIVNEGYVVMGTQYREQDEFGGADINDVITLVDIAKKLPEVNAQRVNMMGVSRGGMMTYLAAKALPDLTSIIVWAGASDLARGLTMRPEMEVVHQARIVNYENDKEAQLKQRSVLYWADKLNRSIPILLLHGDADKAVDVSQSILLSQKLTVLNHPHKMVIYPGGDHGLSKYKKEANKEVVSWLNKYNK